MAAIYKTSTRVAPDTSPHHPLWAPNRWQVLVFSGLCAKARCSMQHKAMQRPFSLESLQVQEAVVPFKRRVGKRLN